MFAKPFNVAFNLQIRDSTFLLLLIFCGSFFSILKNAILLFPHDAAIMLAQENYDPNGFSLFQDWVTQGWSGLQQFGSFLIHLGLNQDFIFRFFSQIGSIALFTGIGLILRSIGVSFIFVISLTILLSLYEFMPTFTSDYHFGGIDTRQLSHFSLYLIILSIGLSYSGRFFLGGLVSFSTICIHPFYGAFFCLFQLCFLFIRYLSKLRVSRNLFNRNFRSFVTGSALGISITLLSFLLLCSH